MLMMHIYRYMHDIDMMHVYIIIMYIDFERAMCHHVALGRGRVWNACVIKNASAATGAFGSNVRQRKSGFVA